MLVKTTMRHDSGAGSGPSAIRLLPALCVSASSRHHSNRIRTWSPLQTCGRLPRSGWADELLNGLQQRIETERLEEVAVATPDHLLGFGLLQELLRGRDQDDGN